MVASTTELLLRFQLAQLEGKLAIYETLIADISRLNVMEQVASDVKTRLEGITMVLCNSGLERDDVGRAQ